MAWGRGWWQPTWRPSAGAVRIPAAVVRGVLLARCADGDHQSETDADTGDEVCQVCGVVTDDYSDVAAVAAEEAGAGER